MAYQLSTHDAKYDRQLRLWGGRGQHALEQAHVLVLGTSPCSTETLKNLVLANVQHLTLVDKAVVTETDFGSNFFTTPSNLGQPRGEAVQQWLVDLNSQTQITCIKESVHQLDLDTLVSRSTLVLTGNQSAVDELAISRACWKYNVNLITVTSVGWFGSVAVQTHEHIVLDTHPSHAIQQLYIHPQLVSHVPEIHEFLTSLGDLQDRSRDPEEHAHIPYAAILVSTMQLWLKSHPSPPSTFTEKQEFKELIRSLRWNPDEVNFEEAINHSYRIYESPDLDHNIRSILNDSRVDSVLMSENKEKSEQQPNHDFWLIIHAIRNFMTSNPQHCPPVINDIPDMHCKPHYYTELKRLYAAAATRDLQAVETEVRKLEQQIGGRHNTISHDLIAIIVRNLRQLRVVRTSPLYDDSTALNPDQLNELHTDWLDTSQADGVDRISPVAIYLLLYVHRQFLTQHGRQPGSIHEELESDALELQSNLQKLVETHHLQIDLPEYLGYELVRCGGSELHLISAVMGGVAAQAALMLLTSQFTPHKTVWVYSGIDANATVV